MVFEPRTLILSFLRSTDAPMAAEIHYMVFIYNSSNLADSVRVAGDFLFILRHLTLIYSCIYEGRSESSRKSAIKSHCFYRLQ